MFLLNLPTELQLVISSFVDRPSLKNLARTNRHFRALWKEQMQKASLKRFAKENDGYFEHVHSFGCKRCKMDQIWISSTEIRFYPSKPGLAPQRMIQRDTCDTCRAH
jgi:F-box domain